VQLPHDATVRDAPQLSVPRTLPQFLPRRVQNVVSLSAVQPQMLADTAPQICGDTHVPHEVTVRFVPQLSAAVTLPQFLPRRVQNAASPSYVQPHTLAAPPPAHVCGAEHAPHGLTVRDVPQLSFAVTLPQFFPRREQKVVSPSYVQPHTFTVPPPPQVCGDAHPAPKLQSATVRGAPQLSLNVTLPQFLPSRRQNVELLSVVQPHTLAFPPPPHVTPVPEHVPHDAVRTAPQLSDAVTLPQFFPSRVQNAVSFSAVQPHTLTTPPPPQLTPVPVHVPHDATVLFVPQLFGAVTVPQSLPSREQNVGSSSAVQPQVFGVPPPPHVTPVPLHVPHDTTVRETPQLSAPVQLPHDLPSREQNVASASAAQPHTLAFPPPPHVTPVPLHVPQFAVRDAPQLSPPVTLPQFLPRRAQNAGSVSDVQPHTLVTPPPPHVTPVPVHAPQFAVRDAPQLSLAVRFPQFLPRRLQNAASFSLVQPQTFVVPPPPQVTPVPVHAPQLAVRDALQLSLAVKLPQFLPRRLQNVVSLSAVQPHTLLAPQTWGETQLPHDTTVRLVPQLSGAVTVPQFFPRREQNCGSVSAVQVHTLLAPQT
jgi:hypothetical protein